MFKQKLSIIFILLLGVRIGFSQPVNQLDSNGLRHGLWHKYYKGTKHLRYEGTFDHGKEVGEFRFYKRSSLEHPTATKTYQKDSDEVAVRYFTQNGKLLSEGKMLLKKRTGTWIYYHVKGAHIMMKELYVDGVLEGETETYFPDGKITERTNYLHGKKQGISKVYSDKGVLLKEFSYDKGELHGLCKYYNSAGELIIEGTYKRDRKDGVWNYYKDGKLDQAKIFPIKGLKRSN